MEAQNNDSAMARKIVNEVLTNGTAYNNLRRLCKEVGPRLSGSPQFLKAVKLTTQMFKDMGVDTVYLQECMVPHWVRGAKEKGEVELKGGKKYQLNLCALGNSVGTGAKGVRAGREERRRRPREDRVLQLPDEPYLYRNVQGLWRKRGVKKPGAITCGKVWSNRGNSEVACN